MRLAPPQPHPGWTGCAPRSRYPRASSGFAFETQLVRLASVRV
ncbi:hypothetical protein [Streptomyces sp. CA-106110]